ELPEADRAKSVYEFFSAQDAFLDASPRDLHRTAGMLGLPDDLYYADRPLAALSGGEKIKVQLAALLLRRPDVLLLDEPSNDLDLETLEWLEGLIRGWTGAVLFISHDETLIEGTANRVILLEQLRRKTVCRHQIANLPFRDFMAQRAAGFERQAQLAGTQRREEKRALEKFQRIQQQVEHAQNTISRGDPHGGQLLKKKMATIKAMERRYERQRGEMADFPEYESPILFRLNEQRPMPAGKTVLEFAAPELRRGDRVLARNVALTVRGGRKVCIIGQNGVGKTTLHQALADSLLPRSDLRCFYMPQDYALALPLEETPIDYLAPSGAKEDVTWARTCLGSMKYTAQEMLHPIRALSGGQKAKLLLLRASLTEVDVLLLDEPTRNFSPLSAPEIRAILRAFPGAILSVSHDRKYLSEVCDTVYRLTPGGLEPVDPASLGPETGEAP
ncbi:MAG: ABC-F family ATP-binding cassette domain-containing protein, partial [Oscillospiraceae bacterium]|nr:ABC-F family ATP-binding cassette domain-containing protein [Oscillospiraceae bacterium]